MPGRDDRETRGEAPWGFAPGGPAGAGPVPEAERLAALYRTGILDSAPEASFDGLARAAAGLFAAPIALIVLVDADRQWAKSALGVDWREAPRADAFCSVLIDSDAPFLAIPDLAADPAYSGVPLAAGPEGIRFYAGVPLLLSGGERIGTLCVLDRRPREAVAAEALAALQGLARAAAALIEAREQAAELRRLHDHAGLSDALGAIALDGLDYAAALDETAQVLGRHLQADVVVLSRFVEEDGREGDGRGGGGLWHAASWTSQEPVRRGMIGYVHGRPLGPADTPSFAAVRDQRPLLVEDVRDPAQFPDGPVAALLRRAGLRQYAVVPFRMGPQRCGIAIGFRSQGADLRQVQDRVLKVRSRIVALLERKQASDRQAFLGSILDQCGEGMAVLEVDPDDPAVRRFVYANRAVTQLTGYAQEELIGASAGMLEPEAERPGEFAEVERALARGETAGLDVRQRCKSGERRWVNLRFAPMRIPAGAPVPAGTGRLIICSVRDVGERRRMVEELRELQEQTRQLFDRNPVPMWLYDRTDLRFRDVNEAALRDYGYSRDEFLEMRLSDLRAGSEAVRPVPGLAAEAGGPAVWRHLTKSGQERLVKIVHHDFDGGAGSRVLVAAIDVTREKSYERSLLEAKYQAEQANAIKSEFLAHMSHEMRTPLNAIIGFSEMIKAGVHGPVGTQKYVEYVDAIRESGGELLYFINDVLQLIEMDSSALSLSRGRVELRELLQDLLQQFAAAFAERNIRLQEMRIPEGLGVLADLRAVRQVLSHVLHNLVKFCDGAAVEIRSAEAASGHRVELSIHDSGPGIPDEILQEIFSPFFTSRSSTRRTGQGAGLGLPICRRLLQAQGGEIRIDSRQGAGTTVLIALPRAPQDTASPDRPPGG